MSREAMLPCLVCGKTLLNEFIEADNQPREGTEFRTYGHYGSTVWDSFNGEELVLNVCDDCLTAHKDRLAQHKRYRPVICERLLVGKYWIEREMVAYTGTPDDEPDLVVEIEELGTSISHVEWCDNIDEVKDYLKKKVASE